jgi:hypothetical protein
METVSNGERSETFDGGKRSGLNMINGPKPLQNHVKRLRIFHGKFTFTLEKPKINSKQ